MYHRINSGGNFSMLKHLYFFILSLFIISFSFAREEIVVIDIQKVVEQSTAGKEAQQLLEKQARMAQQEIQAKAQSGNQQEAQALAAQKQQELMQKRQELIEKFMKTVQEALEKFSKQNGYTIVLDKQAILYNKPEFDKTQEFIKFFNIEYSKGNKLK